MEHNLTRRSILRAVGAGAVGLSLGGATRAGAADPPAAAKPAIQGFEEQKTDAEASRGWAPFSERKVRVGLVGFGVSRFGTAFGFQSHPNVEVVGVSDLLPDRRATMAKVAGCERTYDSLEEMVKDDRIEAVFVATDPPNHAKHAMEVLKHGKHVAVAVPACFGSVEEGERLFEAVKAARGLKYMMFETSCFHEDLYAMRVLYEAGAMGRAVYTEGEYYHYSEKPLGSYKGWRVGMPPLWYPTHATAYHVGVTGGALTAVSCMGFRGDQAHHRPENNAYQNPFGTVVALFRTSEGGSARMVMSKDTPGFGAEQGRMRGTRGTFFGAYQGVEKQLPDLRRPPIPPGMKLGGHGGAHGPLTEEFVRAVILDRAPRVGVVEALNMTVPGIVAHQSALRDGELMKVPVFKA
jgi:predicted dehydrogenase